MNVNETFSKMATELTSMGIHAAKDPVVTVNEIIEIGNDLDIETVEELLNRLTSYNIFLKSQKGSLEAQLIIKESEFKRLLYLSTQAMPKQSDQGSYYTREEKEALIKTTKLKMLDEEVLKLKAIITRIKDVPFAIDRKLMFLQEKYKRLMNEHREKS